MLYLVFGTTGQGQGGEIIARLERAHADLLQLHAQQPFYGDAIPESLNARRTQGAGGTCLSGDFRVTSDARPEVSGCYFDNGTTNYGLPQYTENGVFESGQFWVFPYFDDYRGGVRARMNACYRISFCKVAMCFTPAIVRG